MCVCMCTEKGKSLEGVCVCVCVCALGVGEGWKGCVLCLCVLRARRGGENTVNMYIIWCSHTHYIHIHKYERSFHGHIEEQRRFA